MSESLQPYLFLLLLFLVGLAGKNPSIMIAASILILIKVSGLDIWLFKPLETHGINAGVIIILIAVFIPIANGTIGFQDLWQSVWSKNGIITFLSGLIVSLVAFQGVNLLKMEPELTTALVIGTIAGVAFFRGIPVGPLIGAGIAVLIMRLTEIFRI